jgi:hypothetical protein
MRVALISIDPSFGNCVGIYESLRLKHDVMCFFIQEDPKEFHTMMPCIFGMSHYKRFDFDHYFVVSSDAYVQAKTPPRKTTVVLTDSYFLKNHKTISLKHVRVLCMPDLTEYCRKYDKLFYHPFEWHEPVIKNEELTIAHSPYSRVKQIEKGTEFILSVVPDIDVITGLTWVESIRRKSRAHIFIEQVAERVNGYLGTLGKSGIEAMAVGCFTITSGYPVRGEIPMPPVMRVNRQNMARKLREIEYSDEQQRWVETYLNYEYQSTYLL